MSTQATLLLSLIEVAVLGGLFLILPRIARRGLLFGVYVGEERWGSEDARRVLRGWYGRMALVLAAGVAASLVLAALSDGAAAPSVSLLVVLVGFVWAYLRAHYAARPLAVETRAPAVASLSVEPSAPALLPLITTGLAVAAGLAAVGFALAHYGDLPERIPTHFDASGAPDGWSDRSLVQILLLPLMTLGLGGFMGLLAYFILHAKRSLRHADGGASLLAQDRFRLAISRMLCGVTLLVTTLLTGLSFQQVQVARGIQPSLSPLAIWIGAVGIPVFCIGSILYMMVRYGQGGSRLETAAPGAALTDGIADNRFWKLGAFYVNPEDPSFLVEKRFGFGYTINFGNRWAVIALVGFLIFVLGLSLLGILTA
jgi:uncharacterized membrane protein